MNRMDNLLEKYNLSKMTHDKNRKPNKPMIIKYIKLLAKSLLTKTAKQSQMTLWVSSTK